MRVKQIRANSSCVREQCNNGVDSRRLTVTRRRWCRIQQQTVAKQHPPHHLLRSVCLATSALLGTPACPLLKPQYQAVWSSCEMRPLLDWRMLRAISTACTEYTHTSQLSLLPSEGHQSSAVWISHEMQQFTGWWKLWVRGPMYKISYDLSHVYYKVDLW